MTGTYSGKQLADMLNDNYRLCPEMAATEYVLLMTSIADSQEGFDRLKEALSDIDKKIADSLMSKDGITKMCPVKAKQKKAPCLIKNSMMGPDLITIYPPGIPVVVPGEPVTDEAVRTIKEAIENGLTVTGLNDKESEVIWERSSI